MSNRGGLVQEAKDRPCRWPGEARWGESTQVDPAKVSEVAKRLVQRDIVREMGPEADSYEFTGDLIRLWIEETKSLSRVVEEIT